MEPFTVLLALCEGNPSVTGDFPSQRPVMWSCDVFFDPHVNIEQTIKMPVIQDAIALIMMWL